MSNPNIEQIVKSNAVVWVAPVDTPTPAPTLATGSPWGGAFVRVGFTMAPLSCQYSAEVFSVNVEEHLGAIRRFKTGHEASFETVLAELDLDYLQFATQGNFTSQSSYDQLDVGDTVVMEELLWGFEGIRYTSSGSSKAIRLFFSRANSTLNGPLTFSKRGQENTGISLKIDALADVNNNGRLFRWHYIK